MPDLHRFYPQNYQLVELGLQMPDRPDVQLLVVRQLTRCVSQDTGARRLVCDLVTLCASASTIGYPVAGVVPPVSHSPSPSACR